MAEYTSSEAAMITACADEYRRLRARVAELERREHAAAKVCEAYWNIAAEFISEDEIRRRRDEFLLSAAPPQPEQEGEE